MHQGGTTEVAGQIVPVIHPHRRAAPGVRTSRRTSMRRRAPYGAFVPSRHPGPSHAPGLMRRACGRVAGIDTSQLFSRQSLKNDINCVEIYTEINMHPNILNKQCLAVTGKCAGYHNRVGHYANYGSSCCCGIPYTGMVHFFTFATAQSDQGQL